jgi:hypothetical protein
MIEKIPGRPLINNKLRVILEADLNLSLMGILWGRRLMAQCEKLNASLWGSRTGRSATEVVLQNILPIS